MFLGSAPIKLTDCLDAFFSTEKLCGIDQYYCGQCKTHTDSDKTFQIATLPEVMCIHLKRFRHDAYLSSKINTPVIFPLENLNLKPYCQKNADGMIENAKYDLIGIINHRGGFGGGHYVAYCLNSNSGQWFEFDDSRVTPKTPQEIEQVEAYVLFYRRKASNPKDKSLALSQIQNLNNEKKVYISKIWLNRWNYFVNPGAISNFDFLCEHGAYNSVKYGAEENISLFAKPIPITVFKDFSEIYGSDGSLAVEKIQRCRICEERDQALIQRRSYEKKLIADLENVESKSDGWFVISMKWARDWRSMLNGGLPPGPIENKILFIRPGELRKNLKIDLDYILVNQESWDALFNIYGGGPRIAKVLRNIYSEDL